jgi:uncharacterized protein
MITNLFAFFAGGVFGAGLILSRLVDPVHVGAFLDATTGSDWGLPLAFVIAATVFGASYRELVTWSRRKGRSIEIARPGPIDRSLVLGAMLFGAGWGLTGVCPGPAVVSLGAGAAGAPWSFIAIVVGLSSAAQQRESACELDPVRIPGRIIGGPG